MDVITIESKAYHELMGKIEKILRFVEKEEKAKREYENRLVTNDELAGILGISKRTLQRMRNEQRIGYVVLRGMCQYRQSEIDRLLSECAIVEDAATPADFKRNHTLRTGGKSKRRRT